MKNSELFKQLVRESRHLVLSTHIDPDADGIGSEIALCLALKKLGKDVICVNEKNLARRYQHLDQSKMVLSCEEYSQRFAGKNIDLLVVVDTSNTSRLGQQMQHLVAKSKRVLFVDHHPCSATLQALHCIDTTASATGELVGEFIEYLGIKLTQQMALPLYTAIIIDTNSFRYPTVTARTHRLVAKLLETGVAPPQVYNDIYGTKKVQHMQLLGSILSSAETSKSGKIAWIMVKKESLKKYNVDVEDTHSFINHLLVLDNVKIACMFRDTDHKVKVSLRSMGDIDVGLIAQSLGGGGHGHSAAVLMEGDLKKVIKSTIEKLEQILKMMAV